VRIRLAFGDSGLLIDLPDECTTVVEPRYVAAAADQDAQVRTALRAPVTGRPLRELAGRGQRVAISVCDGTRPQPRRLMVPAVLDELEQAGVRPEDIVVLVATGTHRGNNPGELEAMFGTAVLDRVRVVNHDARDDASLTYVGRYGDAVPVWLNRAWVEADLRVTTGFVEPHFFAGFSGGPKMVAPGLAGLDTVLTLHDAKRIAHPRATWGVLDGNPIHEDVRAIATATGVDFAFDVVLNRDQDIVRAFAGDLSGMHAAACAAAREVAMRPVPAPFDVVVTTNSGYPLDQNLYQCVKGMSAAAQIVKPGGLIVCAAECRDGLPDHGSYRDILTAGRSPAEILERILHQDHTIPDQWQAQIQAKIQAHARIAVHTSGLSDAELRGAHLEPAPDLAATVLEELRASGPAATVCVLPEGPQTIPYLSVAGEMP